MALVSRRRLALSLRGVAPLVSYAKLNDWTSRLDKVRDDYSAAEWEIILLESFSKRGEVNYEPRSDQRIDIVFNRAGLSFAADITTISDRFLHQRNPVHQFSEELGRQARKNKILTVGGFSYDIWQDQGVLVRDQHRAPLLPHVSKFRETIFNNKWIEFVRMIREKPTVQYTYYAVVGKSKIKISYLPSLKGHTTGSFGSYTGANVLNDNPLYNGLHEKARKLRKSNYSGPIGVIVCDGGCRMLSASPTWESYTVAQVIAEFLRKHRSIDFVGTIAVQPRLSVNQPLQSHYGCLPKFYARSDSKFSLGGISEVFHHAVSDLPAIKTFPDNIINVLNWRRPKAPYRPYLGGWTYSESALTLSARELLEVLSGKMPHYRFHENHQLANGSNSFVMRIAQGQRITGVKLHKQPEEDDDLVTLEFSRKENEEDRSIQSKDGMANQTIWVDAQTLLYFLAGTIGFSEFSRAAGAPNRFLNHLEAGELFSDLTFRTNRDQSTIAFAFGESDPAVAPFRQTVSFSS